MPQNAAAAQTAIVILTTLSAGDDGAMTPNGVCVPPTHRGCAPLIFR
jgi:hypothetical protein